MTYRFGPYELDEAGRELRRDGKRVDTEPKAFELLLYLVKNRDRAVSKDELQTALWPRAIVTEASLTRSVMKARRCVGDDASRQSVIRTVHSHGYRFIAELGEGTPATPPDTVRIGETATMAALRRHWKPRMTHYLFAVAIVLLVAAAIALLKLRDPAPPVTSGTVAVLPIDNRVDNENLQWVRLGLMSLLTRMLEDTGIEVADENAVSRLAAEYDVSKPPDDEMLEHIRLGAAAGVVLNTTLDQQGGLFRLAATVTYGDGRRTRRVIVGDSPAELASDMARVVAGIVSGSGIERVGRFSKVSANPFVNELYARALDLELQGELEDARALFQIAANEEPELFFLRYEIALCTRDLREWGAAEAQFEALYQEALSGDDARALIVTLNSSGIMYFNRNNYDTAEERFTKALEVARGARYADERASVHINLALIAGVRNDTALAKAHYEKALEAYRVLGKEPSPNFNNNYAGLLLDLGDLATAQRYSELAVEGFRVRGQRRFEAPTLNRLAKILRRRGDIEAAMSRHQQARLIYQELGDAIGELSVMAAMTSIYREKGDLTRARLNADEVLSRARELDDDVLLAAGYMQSASVAAEFGLYSDALSGFEAARTVFESIGDAAGLREADENIAITALALGDKARALSIAQLSLEVARAAEDRLAEARTRCLLGHIAQTGGETSAAITHYRAALDYVREHNSDSLRIDAATRLARVYLETGDIDAAAKLAEEIREQAASQRDFMRLDARLALARGDAPRALGIMTRLRSVAGEAWNPEDDELLAQIEPPQP